MPGYPLRMRGAALILVLWLVAALSLTVLAGVRSVRQHNQHGSVDLERLRVEPVLDAARQLAVQALIADPARSRGYGIWHMQLDAWDVQLQVIPSVGLIDVNVASDALLTTFLQRVGSLSADQAAIMAAHIHDYIDPDDTPSGVGGAEAAQYRAAGWPVLPRNGALADLTELRMVLGMTPELYDIISPYLGLNGQQHLVLDATPPALIDALTGQPGLGERIYSTPPEMRAAWSQSDSLAQLFGAAATTGGMVKVIASVRSDEGRWWEREAWMDLNPRPDTLTPWTTISLEATHRMPTPPSQGQP